MLQPVSRSNVSISLGCDQEISILSTPADRLIAKRSKAWEPLRIANKGAILLLDQAWGPGGKTSH